MIKIRPNYAWVRDRHGELLTVVRWYVWDNGIRTPWATGVPIGYAFVDVVRGFIEVASDD